MCSDAPDTSGMNKAAEKQAEIGERALSWYQEMYKDSAPERKAASAAALEQAGLQRDLAVQSMETQRQERDRYNTTFKPIESKIAADAMAYDTPARREAAAREAMASQEIALSGARQAGARMMERRGVTPNAGRSQGLQTTLTLGAAKAKAGAANVARERVATVGAAKLADAAGLGRGVITNQGTQAQIGLSAGNSSVGNASVPLSISQQGAQLGGQGFGTALQGYQGSANTYGQIAGIQSGVDAQNSQSTMAGASTIAMVGVAI